MEFLHHPLSNLGAFYFSLSSFLKMKLHAVDDLLKLIDADRPLLAGLFQAIQDLEAIERLSPPVLLHDQRKGILRSLTGRKSFMTAETLPSPPNRIFLFSQSGIDHFAFGMAAKGTLHIFECWNWNMESDFISTLYFPPS